MKKISKNEALKSRNTVIAVQNGKAYHSIFETDYKSSKNVIGVSAYPFGFGPSVFLDETAVFVEGGEYQHPKDLFEEFLNGG